MTHNRHKGPSGPFPIRGDAPAAKTGVQAEEERPGRGDRMSTEGPWTQAVEVETYQRCGAVTRCSGCLYVGGAGEG